MLLAVKVLCVLLAQPLTRPCFLVDLATRGPTGGGRAGRVQHIISPLSPHSDPPIYYVGASRLRST